MKYYINEIKLWFKNNSEPKCYELKPNKINVITGDATKGKTSFLKIIDYCLLSKKNRIVQSIINENVSWYCINFFINDKNFIIARKSPEAGEVSAEVYFSDRGIYPTLPVANISIFELKEVLNKEFSIPKIEYPTIKNPQILSFREFLVLTSISADIIITSNNYFDKSFYEIIRDEDLKHIFYISTGIDKIQNILIEERRKPIEQQISRLANKISTETATKKRLDYELALLITECKEYNLLNVDFDYSTYIEAYIALNQIVKDYIVLANNEKIFKQVDSLNKEKRNLIKKINAIESFRNEVDIYHKNLNKYADSLKPIEYLANNFSEIIPSRSIHLFINSLEDSLKEIKIGYKKTDFKFYKYQTELTSLNERLKQIDIEIKSLPKIKSFFTSEAAKYIFIGNLQNKLTNNEKNRLKLDSPQKELLANLKEELEKLDLQFYDIDKNKYILNEELNKSIQKIYSLINSMPNYKNHIIRFDIDEMVLKLKNPTELFESEDIGSSSNYMFLHLCFYLGLHEYLIKNNHKHVPQFLFIDQPSFPYFSGGDKVKTDDKEKLQDAFKLINSFMSFVINDLKSDFQIFMVEHAPKEYWEDNDLEYFHTVDEFINGNGLIPQYVLLNNTNENDRIN
jgi:hypothetical protein